MTRKDGICAYNKVIIMLNKLRGRLNLCN